MTNTYLSLSILGIILHAIATEVRLAKLERSHESKGVE
jgi:hypothetical protein